MSILLFRKSHKETSEDCSPLQVIHIPACLVFRGLRRLFKFPQPAFFGSSAQNSTQVDLFSTQVGVFAHRNFEWGWRTSTYVKLLLIYHINLSLTEFLPILSRVLG